MSWFLSVITLLHMWLMGNKWKYAPHFGVVIQIPWMIYAIMTEQYGLILGAVGFIIVNTRNAIKWKE